MTDKFEIEPVVRLHSEDGACLEVGTDPDIPGLVEIRTPNQVSLEILCPNCHALHHYLNKTQIE